MRDSSMIVAVMLFSVSACTLVDRTGHNDGDNVVMTADDDFFSDVAEMEVISNEPAEIADFCNKMAPPPPMHQRPELRAVLYEDPTAGLSAQIRDEDGYARGAGIRLVTLAGNFENFWAPEDPEVASVGFGTVWVDQMDSTSSPGVFFILNHGDRPVCVNGFDWHGGDKLPYSAWAVRGLNFTVMPGDEVLVGGYERHISHGVNRWIPFRDF